MGTNQLKWLNFLVQYLICKPRHTASEDRQCLQSCFHGLSWPLSVYLEKKKIMFQQKGTKGTQVLVIGRTLSTEKISALSYPRSYRSLENWVTPGCKVIWIPESWKFSSRSPELGSLKVRIRSPISFDKESSIQYLESRIHSVESRRLSWTTLHGARRGISLIIRFWETVHLPLP